MPKHKKIAVVYDPDNLRKALDEVRKGGKIRETARKYGVPKSTLQFKVKNPNHKSTYGPSPYLTDLEEAVLRKWIVELVKKGFPLKKEDLQSSVQNFLNENPRKTPFKDNYPGDGWVRGFLKRHPDIGLRTSEGVTFSSACVSETDIRKWFSEIRQYFEDNDLLEVMNDPSRVFNGDESGFQLCPKTGKVLALKGMKNVYNVETSSSKDSMTVMFTFSAAGQCCPPMIVYKYQRIPQKVTESIPPDWGVGRSENGWMTSEVFFEYIANVFYPYLVKENIPLPVIYFLDGHKTHLTYQVSKLCTELKIELVALYPNATRILQPADVAVFRPVKAAWKASVREWLNQNPGQVITKVNFAEVLKEALRKSIKAQTLKNGFRACGLVPFDPDNVDYTKCVPNKSVDVDNIHPPNDDDTITFSHFLCLIGPSKAAELQNIKNIDDIYDDNLEILYKISKSFSQPLTISTSKTNHTENLSFGQEFTPNIIESPNITIEPSILLNTAHEYDSDLTRSPTILNNYENFDDILISQNDVTYAVTTSQTLEQTESQAKPKPKLTILQDILMTKQSDSNSSCGLCPITGILTKTETSRKPSNSEIDKTLETPTKKSKNMSQPLLALSEISPAFKICHSDIGTYLTLPKTPERKGKREVKRMPFAITSAKYKAMYKEQIEKKELDLREKEARKKIREEAKIKKGTCKKNNLKEETKGKRKSIREDTNACKICAKTTKTVNRVICDICSSIYHVKCVPKIHQIHVPEDISIDSYVCHTCYKEDDNDEIDLDDDLRMSSEENTEEWANDLYHSYLSLKKL